MKKYVSALLAVTVSLAFLAGCGGQSSSGVSSQVSSSSAPVSEAQSQVADKIDIRVAGLKGPTTMGMVKLMSDAEAGQTKNNYTVEMYGTADELNGKLIKGDIDIAALPANVASVLYNKTQGEIQVAAINTLGVLYMVESGDSIHSIADLKGKTIYSTGKGTTPEFVLNYLLKENGLVVGTDVMVEYKSEATEVAAMLKESDDAIAVLPQPYVTAVLAQNENFRVALSLTEEWNNVAPESSLVTGVLVVRREFAEKNPEAFQGFLDEYKQSIAFTEQDVAAAAELVVRFGIVEKAPIAEKALPECNIVYIDGSEMKAKLSGYLQVLFEEKAESVGGEMPADDFYWGA